jgi:cysteine dioxygenase
MTAQVYISYDCCEGLDPSEQSNNQSTGCPAILSSFPALNGRISKIFLYHPDWKSRKSAIDVALKSTILSPAEIAKYAHFDCRFPYTRNLVASDGIHYSLLLLCWNEGMESKIHDHPCDGCFVKALQGDIRETKYSKDQDADQLLLSNETVIRDGSVTYMDNSIGYHKVGNAGSIPAITLHLYTPPYHSCKVT